MNEKYLEHKFGASYRREGKEDGRERFPSHLADGSTGNLLEPNARLEHSDSYEKHGTLGKN